MLSPNRWQYPPPSPSPSASPCQIPIFSFVRGPQPTCTPDVWTRVSCGRVPEKCLGHRPSIRPASLPASQPACQQFIWFWSSIPDTDLRSYDPPADRTPGTGTNTYIHPALPKLRYMRACLRVYMHTHIHTYIPRYRRTYVHTNTHAYTTHHTHTSSMPCQRDQRHHALFWNARSPVQAVGSATGRAGLYGLTPVGCLSETSSPCRTAQDPHPQSHAISKGSIKAPAFALPLASRTGSPTHTREVGFPGTLVPQSLQRVGQTASAPSAISNLHAAGSHAA